MGKLTCFPPCFVPEKQKLKRSNFLIQYTSTILSNLTKPQGDLIDIPE